MKAGDHHYRAWVGPPENYDIVAGMQFALLIHLGLREHHTLLDVGCGSLRGGRLFIPYLLPERYFGIEPHRWLIEEGIRNELGDDIRRVKRPRFSDEAGFRLSVFGERFDYILAQSIFSHAARRQIERCLTEADATLAVGGAFVATYFVGDADNTGEEWSYPQNVRYRRDTMRSLVNAAGLEYRELSWPHPTGQTWFTAFAPGPGGPEADLTTFVGLRERLDEYERRLEERQRPPNAP